MSKRFRLHSGSIKHALLDRKRGRDEIWAVRDVSFELARGSAFGVVGANGSGKSTLLKLLSGVMQPTAGRIETRGRIGTLIEIGAGFHPDLSGRDNVYLNAALLGLRRSEVRRRFDEIVSFSELERFIDMPVKRYSSGMFLRLGFSIAAHVDPDVLLIDEVLAVGDAAFQRKCLRRLREFRQSGGTMVLVTHGLGLVVEHCQGAIWLDAGVVRAQGDPSSVTDAYARSGSERAPLMASELDPLDWPQGSQAGGVLVPARGAARVVGIQILDLHGQPCSRVRPGEAVLVRIGFQGGGRDEHIAGFELRIVRTDGTVMFTSTAAAGHELPALPQQGDVIVQLPFVALGPGLYNVQAAVRGDSTVASAALEIGGDEASTDSTYMPATWRLAG